MSPRLLRAKVHHVSYFMFPPMFTGINAALYLRWECDASSRYDTMYYEFLDYVHCANGPMPE
eukprot:409960-Pyramimonas_sp.AAC.1